MAHTFVHRHFGGAGSGAPQEPLSEDGGDRDQAFAAEMSALDGNQALMADALARYRENISRLGSVKGRAQRLQLLMTGSDTLEQLPISDVLEQNVRSLEMLFRASSDWVIRRFRIAGGREALLTYIDGLVHSERVDSLIMKPLMFEAFPIRDGGAVRDVRRLLSEHAISTSQVKEGRSIREIVDGIIKGDTALLIDGNPIALIISVREMRERNVGEPDTEAVIRGPREGFVESLRMNTALIRRRIRTPHLKIESLSLGVLSRTDVAVLYIEGIVPDEMVDEVKSRLERIDIDAILDSGYIEELIEDDPISPFPQVLSTERPDVLVGQLLEGRVGILTEGSPFALAVPTTLWSLMQASEDYYNRWLVGTALRGLRYIFTFIALLFPSTYVAITTFHQEMIPTALLLTVAAAREGIPFPSFVEALMMEVAFEVLREAGVRLPKQVGQAVSIVGALVIGQAAVQAGVVSAPMVIVVATTGIASFAIPRFNLGIAIRLLRFPLIFLAGFLGLYGIMLGLIFILVHLSGLRSFGIPYLSPVAPVSMGDLKDVLVRVPIWFKPLRPRLTAYPNPRRQKTPIKPGPKPWENEE